jgi:hypothetical protein
MKERTANILFIAVALVAWGAVFFLVFPPASADVFVYGSNPNYSAVILPNNSYVHQGENISQGNWYDLSGVAGFSGLFAYWEYDEDVGYTVPTTIVTLDNLRWVYIDPVIFPAGRWFMWDGEFCKDADYSCSSGFGRGNNYAFAVVKPSRPLPQVTSVNSEIVVSSGDTIIKIPVTLLQAPVTEATPDIAANNITTIVIPTATPEPTTEVTLGAAATQNPGIDTVTPKSDVPVAVSFIALLGVFLVFKSRK